MLLITYIAPFSTVHTLLDLIALAMNGVQLFFFCMAYGQLLAGGAGCTCDDPSRHPWDPKAANDDGRPTLHIINDPLRDRPPAYRCPVCHRYFPTMKAVHGHYRTHN